MSNKEKTLKEKVGEARNAIRGLPGLPLSMTVIEEALTALEERVAELEVDVDYYMCLLPADSPLILDKHKEAQDAEK